MRSSASAASSGAPRTATGRWSRSSARVLGDGLPAVEAACAEALAEGVHSADPQPSSSDRWRTWLALEQQRNLVLLGGTGTGKSHLATGIVRACIRGGARGALLQRRQSGEQARRRGARRAPGPDRRPPLPPRLRGPRRARLSPLRPDRRPAPLPPGQPALRADLGDRHHQPRHRPNGRASSGTPR